MEDNTLGPAGLSTSDPNAHHVTRQETSPTYSTFALRRQAGMAVSVKETTTCNS